MTGTVVFPNSTPGMGPGYKGPYQNGEIIVVCSGLLADVCLVPVPMSKMIDAQQATFTVNYFGLTGGLTMSIDYTNDNFRLIKQANHTSFSWTSKSTALVNTGTVVLTEFPMQCIRLTFTGAGTARGGAKVAF